ncbi:hypothetical protein LATKL145_01320 [Lactobacillus amylovorus subsp. animalium]|uniref:Uncharacterized protein n=1 Tax=Lactobacillus amylovorus subsp. animalium TaxID=3378536 RepID=A0ABC9VKM2_LACAM
MKTRRVKRFDLKIGSIITPHELSNVFQYEFMKYQLGVTYSSYSRKYVARSINDKGIDVRFDDELVYLGFGHWKKNTKEAK